MVAARTFVFLIKVVRQVIRCVGAFDSGHWPSQHDAGQPESWIPVDAWNFIRQF